MLSVLYDIGSPGIGGSAEYFLAGFDDYVSETSSYSRFERILSWNYYFFYLLIHFLIMDRSKVLREIDVCKLLHSNSEECLELSSFCSILLSSTTNLAGSSNPASTADVVTHRHVWIDRGEGLRLNISIVFGPNLLCLEQREDIVNDLATKLVESQVQ